MFTKGLAFSLAHSSRSLSRHYIKAFCCYWNSISQSFPIDLINRLSLKVLGGRELEVVHVEAEVGQTVVVVVDEARRPGHA